MKEFRINIQDREIIVLQDDDGFFIKPEMVTELEKQGTAQNLLTNLSVWHENLILRENFKFKKTVYT